MTRNEQQLLHRFHFVNDTLTHDQEEPFVCCHWSDPLNNNDLSGLTGMKEKAYFY